MTDPRYVLFLVKVHMQLLLVYKHSIQLIKINIYYFVTWLKISRFGRAGANKLTSMTKTLT